MDRSAEAAYEAIAPVYDEFTAHHDRELWLDELLPRLESGGLRRGRLLDVACGTGKSFLPMLARGWEVTACDISPAMLALAREKVDAEAVSLHVADMRALPHYGEFDLVWALDDSLNYLLSPEELLAALQGMRGNLAPSGFLVFDLNTLYAYRSFFSETTVVERNGVRLVWEGKADPAAPPGSIADARFRVEGADVSPHLHRQRHFSQVEVRAACLEAGLRSVEIFGHGDETLFRQPLDEDRHTKAVYIARL